MKSPNPSKYNPHFLANLFIEERQWFNMVFSKLETKDLGWKVPNTPYTLDWLLWHIAESAYWVNNAVIKMRKKNGAPIDYPKWVQNEKTLLERAKEYKKQSMELEKVVRNLTVERLNSEQEYMGMHGPSKKLLGDIILEHIFHVTGHITVCSFIHNLRERIEGKPQKWPPY